MVTHKDHSNETLSKNCCKAWVSCAIALYAPSLCQRITLKRNYDSSIIESTPFYHRTSLTLLVLCLTMTIIILIFSNRRNKNPAIADCRVLFCLFFCWHWPRWQTVWIMLALYWWPVRFPWRWIRLLRKRILSGKMTKRKREHFGTVTDLFSRSFFILFCKWSCAHCLPNRNSQYPGRWLLLFSA